MITKIRIFVFVSFLMTFLAGCAPSGRALPRFVWPPPPEQPRLEYVGNYTSAEDFKQADLLDKLAGKVKINLFAGPFGVVSDGEGRVFVSDIAIGMVHVIDFREKTFKPVAEAKILVNPAGMAVDAQKNLYVADSGASQVLVFDAELRPKGTIRDPDHLTKPVYVAIQPETQRIYVTDGADSRVAVFSPQGEFLFGFGQRGAGVDDLFAPQGLEFGPDGNLYICDTLNARIKVVTPEGKFVRMFGERGDVGGMFESPKDLAFDSEGNLFVVDARKSNLMTYTPEGIYLLSTGSNKPDQSKFGFSMPKSVFIDRNDRIYVAENLGRRLSVWQYLSAAYLRDHPFTDADRQNLLDFMALPPEERDRRLHQ